MTLVLLEKFALSVCHKVNPPKHLVYRDYILQYCDYLRQTCYLSWMRWLMKADRYCLKYCEHRMLCLAISFLPQESLRSHVTWNTRWILKYNIHRRVILALIIGAESSWVTGMLGRQTQTTPARTAERDSCVNSLLVVLIMTQTIVRMLAFYVE